jgi:hypothetical protein
MDTTVTTSDADIDDDNSCYAIVILLLPKMFLENGIILKLILMDGLVSGNAKVPREYNRNIIDLIPEMKKWIFRNVNHMIILCNHTILYHYTCNIILSSFGVCPNVELCLISCCMMSRV